jgi:hypothetical protein
MLVVAVCGTAAAAASGSTAAVAAPRAASPAVEVCGQGPAVSRPRSVILTCADDGELATGLHWSNWTAAKATATGLVTWRSCTVFCAYATSWDRARADVTLSGPAREHGKGVLFTRLTLHVTGRTPPGFLRELTFSEAPTPPAPAPSPSAGRPVPLHTLAPSGTLGYAQIEGFWILAGGATASQGGYTDAQIAAAITGTESSFLPGIIQPYVDYCGPGADRAGWGLWQITCGDSVPQYGTDFQILDPWNNAEAAVAKYDSAGGFTPWSTYTDGAYARYLQHTTADLDLTDPGEYAQIYSAPSKTPSSPGPAAGSTYGPPVPAGTPPSVAMTGTAAAYVFWRGTDGNLWEAQGPADGALSGPVDLGMGQLGSAPTAAVDANGDVYVYWEGTNQALWEAYWNGAKWAGPYDRGMGPLGSAPSVAVTAGGTAFVFWKGTGGNLWEAQGPAGGPLNGPYYRGMGPLGSAPTAGVDGNGATYVYWEGTNQALWEAYWNGAKWVGGYNRGMGPLGSAPTVTVTGTGTAYVFWRGTDGNLWEAQGPATGPLRGAYRRGLGPLASAPAAGVDANGSTYVYWKAANLALWEDYWNGSAWAGSYDRGMG